MDTGLRKRFVSPVFISKASAEGSKNFDPIASSPQRSLRGQWSLPSLTPASASGSQVSKSESVMSSNRSQEKRKSSETESINERGARQKVCRSLFNIKPTGCEKKNDLGQQSCLKRSAQPKDLEHSLSRSDMLGTSSRKMSISLAELSTPEILSEANLMNAPFDCIMEESFLIGQLKKLDVLCPFDFCDILKPEAVEKFKSAIKPTKVHLPTARSVMESNIDSVISCLDLQDSCIKNPRLSNKEKFVQMLTAQGSASSDISTNSESTSGDPSGAGKSKKHYLQSPSSCDPMFFDLPFGKKRMMRGFCIPRCGRPTNQSYQEQAKEFQDILSSKVRQIAEVADCLQHTELLYKILDM
ncbi:hypothetical protein L7F22_032147 [Adiantum nelumboides]|nr:hypothetical protein [Adiantum nelumboides]